MHSSDGIKQDSLGSSDDCHIVALFDTRHHEDDPNDTSKNVQVYNTIKWVIFVYLYYVYSDLENDSNIFDEICYILINFIFRK